MTTRATATSTLRHLAESATMCPTCGSEPNAANFGGMCDPCQTRSDERNVRTAALLRSRGMTEGHENRVLLGVGDRSAARLAR